MTQRIPIETPNGTVYLGEECEYFTNERKWDNRGVISSVSYIDSSVYATIHFGVINWGIDKVRPIQPKKMRPMNKAELVQLVMKGAEFFNRDGRSVVSPPVYTRFGVFNINGWPIEEVTNYTLPGDPTKRKLEVEE